MDAAGRVECERHAGVGLDAVAKASSDGHVVGFSAISPLTLNPHLAPVNRILAQPDIPARLDASDNVPTGGSAGDFVKVIAAESAGNARIIQAAGIRAE